MQQVIGGKPYALRLARVPSLRTNVSVSRRPPTSRAAASPDRAVQRARYILITGGYSFIFDQILAG
jgi:hypothetical protein